MRDAARPLSPACHDRLLRTFSVALFTDAASICSAGTNGKPLGLPETTGREETMSNDSQQTVSRRSFITGLASVAGAAALGAGLTGCGPTQPTKASASGESKTSSGVMMKPGQYTAGARGAWQIWELPVTITVNETALLKIEVPEYRFDHGETEVVLQCVKEKLFPRMIEAQSVEVDSITGATMSSMAVKTSVEAALKQALAEGGSDESAISHFKQPVTLEPEETKELETDVLIVGMSTGGMIAMCNAVETIQSLNGGKRVSVLAIDMAGKYGGRSALTHEAQSVNPKKYLEKYNNGEPFIDADLLRDMWIESVTDENGVCRAKPEMVEMFIANSGDTIDWLMDHGWSYGTMHALSKVAPGSIEFNTALTSNVDLGTYEDRRVMLEGYYQGILAKSKAQGAEYMLETEAYEFIYDTQANAVKGVKARSVVNGQEYVINAKAVIMGCGGFGSNAELMDSLLDPRWAGLHKNLGMGTDTGLMMQAALNIGAGTWNADMSPIIMHVGLPRYLDKYPVNVVEGGLVGRTGRYNTWTLNDVPLGMALRGDAFSVGPDGKRFGNESQILSFAPDLHGKSYCCYVTGPFFYTIFTQAEADAVRDNGFTSIPRWEGYVARGGVPKETPIPEMQEILDAAISEGLMWKADTLQDLAGQIEVDATTLEASLRGYNDACAKGNDDEFQKDPSFLVPLGDGPFYAVKIMNVAFSTIGGLDVDEQIRVLKDDHATPIKGLYAIGNDSAGVLLTPENNYTVFPGVAQGWNQTSGRLAGANAARFVGDEYGFAEVTGVLLELDSHTV